MRDNQALQVQPHLISFSEFLSALFQALDKAGVRFCVLRNYEGFPSKNVGSDLDILIFQFDLPAAVCALRSIQGIRIVGYAERYYVAHTFVAGVSPATGIRALAVDFIWDLNWKGLPYLTTNTVMQAAIQRHAGDLCFLVPLPVHEAIISLLSSLLIGRTVKEKYFPSVQNIFTCCKSDVISVLLPGFGLKKATRLVDFVIGGDRDEIRYIVSSLRVSLALRHLLRGPVRCFICVAKYYKREYAVRCTPETIESIRILSLDSDYKTTIVNDLIPLLKYTAKLVEIRNYEHHYSADNTLLSRTTKTDFNDNARVVIADIIVKAVRWLLNEWISLFKKKDNLTLRIIENSYYDTLIREWMYGVMAPGWLARLIMHLLPTCDLWILLDMTAEKLQSRNGEVSFKAAYMTREFVSFITRTGKKHVILDSSKPVADVTEDAYASIIETIALRTDKRLENRFGLTSAIIL
jgi:hypothetical protein